MYHRQENDVPDELKGRFTKWLDITLYRAKLKYIQKSAHQIKTISIDDMDIDTFQVSEDAALSVSSEEKKCFEFEEERLARAFSELPIKRQRILEMLFVEEKNPRQIAKELNCSEAYVYNQKHLALQKLRDYLQKR